MHQQRSSLPASRLSLDALDEHLSVVHHGVLWHEAGLRVATPLSIGGSVLYAHPTGPALGFRVRRLHALRDDELRQPELRTGPRFCVPALALDQATIAEVLLGAREHFLPDEMTCAEEHSLRGLEAWMNERLDDAEFHWRKALQAGDLTAHRRLGHLLLERGDDRGAYGHLRCFTTIDPTNQDAWRALERASAAIGQHQHAAHAPLTVAPLRGAQPPLTPRPGRNR